MFEGVSSLKHCLETGMKMSVPCTLVRHAIAWATAFLELLNETAEDLVFDSQCSLGEPRHDAIERFLVGRPDDLHRFVEGAPEERIHVAPYTLVPHMPFIERRQI